jgi:hypothetical protein
MINKTICLIFLVCFISLFFCASSIATGPLREVKIFMVHSYSANYICTAPQYQGIIDNLRLYSDKYKFNVRGVYMKTKVTNITRAQKKDIASHILRVIDTFDPDYVYTTDDNAFEYVGIPASKKYKIIASGVNRPYNQYENNYADILNNTKDNICVIQELIRLDQLFRLFDFSKFNPSTFHVFIEPNGSKSNTSYNMENNYISEIQGKGKIVKHEINNLYTLKDKLINLNKQRNVNVLVLALQRVYDPDSGKFISKDEFSHIIPEYNTKHVELAGNPLFTKAGISICAAPSFEYMGRLSGKVLITDLEANSFKHLVISTPNEIWVNKKRLDELYMSHLYKEPTSLIKKYVESY